MPIGEVLPLLRRAGGRQITYDGMCVYPYFPCKTSSSNTHGICRSREQAPRDGGIPELRKCVPRCEETIIELPGGGRKTQAVGQVKGTYLINTKRRALSMVALS